MHDGQSVLSPSITLHLCMMPGLLMITLQETFRLHANKSIALPTRQSSRGEHERHVVKIQSFSEGPMYLLKTRSTSARHSTLSCVSKAARFSSTVACMLHRQWCTQPPASPDTSSKPDRPWKHHAFLPPAPTMASHLRTKAA